MDIQDFDEIDILEMIDERHMTFLESSSSRHAIETLVNLLASTNSITNRETVLSAVAHREKIVSTGIGFGIALPHARVEGVDSFQIAVGIQKEGSIPWASIDDIPVRIVLLIIGPQQQDHLYLKVLSLLTEIVRTPEIRSQLVSAKDISELAHLFETCYT
ncbi:MAG: PTS sugar transporter subunit IIA [Chlamydiae bacterium]|nr:PTS sugar transporter subunit IIA [Chlamydiota bacterium]